MPPGCPVLPPTSPLDNSSSAQPLSTAVAFCSVLRITLPPVLPQHSGKRTSQERTSIAQSYEQRSAPRLSRTRARSPAPSVVFHDMITVRGDRCPYRLLPGFTTPILPQCGDRKMSQERASLLPTAVAVDRYHRGRLSLLTMSTRATKRPVDVVVQATGAINCLWS